MNAENFEQLDDEIRRIGLAVFLNEFPRPLALVIGQLLENRRPSDDKFLVHIFNPS
jgi:hypothetical protein